MISKIWTAGKDKNSIMKIALLVAAFVIALYALAGFLVVPSFVKSGIENSLSKNLDAKTTIKAVAINPFTLSVKITGFKMDHEGKTLARFDELYVNFQSSSLFHRAYTFSEIRLVAPEGLVEIMPDDSCNWSHLILAKETQSPDEKPATGEIVPLLIHRLYIDKGHLRFSDFSLETPFETDLSPIQISLEKFSTRKDDNGLFKLSSTLGKGGELAWEGTLSVNPLKSQGKLELRGILLHTLWEYIRDHVEFEIGDGLADAKTQYAFETRSGNTHFELKDGSLTIKDTTLSKKGEKESLISMPLLACQGVSLNLEDKKIEIDSVSSSGAEISVLRQNDGTINYQTLFVSPKSEDTQTNEEKSWIAGIKNLSLKDYKINFTDEAPATPVSASFSSISLDMKNLGNAKGSKSDIFLKAKVNETGSIKVNGTAGIDPYTADLALSVSDVALKPFQSYADYFSKIDITGGSAGLQGKLGYDAAASDKPKMLYRGNFRIDDFHSNDRAQFNDLLKCKSLVLGDMEIDLLPGRLHIADISLTGPYAKVVIFKDGTTNLSKVFGKEDGADAPAQDNKKEEKGDKFPVAIDSISVKEGSMNFADLSLEPSFATGIHNLMGSIKGLSSDPLARANVSLTGAVDKYAPVRIEGKINPLAPKKFVDIALSFKNIEMTTLTPYSGKYAGYPIEKGKMSVDLDYKLDGSKLVGKNKIFLNQLILGDKVESPSATSLPVSLAIALLRDRDGNIDIDLPVTGDIDDPDFSYGQLVLKALVSLITKIVTSPFALIGSLFGGGEELNQIEFEYGSSELTPEQTGKLDVIARALYERPALRLEIKGVADKTSDRSALAEKAVTRNLKKLKADELQAEKKEVSPILDDIEISDEEYPVLLVKAYEILQETKKTDEEKPEATPDTMKQALIDTTNITDMDLQQLALNRAQQIKGYLLEAGKIENERVFILDAQITDTPENEKPFAMLSLL